MDDTGIINRGRISRSIRRTNEIAVGDTDANVGLADDGPVDVREDPIGNLIANQQVLDEERDDDDDDEEEETNNYEEEKKKTAMAMMKSRTKTRTMKWLFHFVFCYHIVLCCTIYHRIVLNCIVMYYISFQSIIP